MSLRSPDFDHFLSQEFAVQTIKVYAEDHDGNEVVTCIPFNEFMLVQSGLAYQLASRENDMIPGSPPMPPMEPSLILHVAERASALFIETVNQTILGIDGTFRMPDGNCISIDNWKTDAIKGDSDDE